jgi:hypothetical protein
MDEDLSRSPEDPPEPRRRRRWQAVDAKLDEAARDPRYNPYRRARRRPRPVLVTILVAAAAFCIAFAAAPLLAFRALRSAAEFGDGQALRELVDYPAVRESLRSQIRPASAEHRPPADLLHDPVGALRRALAPVGPQADVDAYLTPEALR